MVINAPCFYNEALASPKQTAIGKDSIIAPCFTNEAIASPKQTAIGKDLSNPFMAGSLPKTTLMCESVSYNKREN
ncbi:hypothetical protein Tco_0283994, partial [Tanacetum coccineum]